MAIRPDNTLISNREMLLELISVAFRPFATAFHAMAANSTQMQALERIAAVSDAELQAKGLTRAQAVSMTFRHDA